jgi:phenylacetate-CoA ligase
MDMLDLQQNKQAEFFDPDRIKEIQKVLFKKQLMYLARNSPYYKQKLGKATPDLEKMEIEDITDLPLTDKSEFNKYNDEFLATPLTQICDIVCSSGTTGKPTKVMYTKSDLFRLSFNEEMSFTRCDITSDDVFLLTCTMDRCFVAGLAYYLGIQNIGAAAIRNGISSLDSHCGIIERFKPTVLVGVPSFLRKLGLYLTSMGIDSAQTSVSKLICIGETIRNKDLSLLNVGRDLEEVWGAKIFSTYASTEMVTTFCECIQQQGGHFHPALAVAEIIDNKGNVLPFGEIGELVVTPLFVEGMPLLRFKTGDISFLMDEPCDCGRSSIRLGPVLGRKKQMIKYNGTTIYPQTIYSVLDASPNVNEYFIVVSNDESLSDDMKIYLSVKGNMCSSDDIRDELQSHLRIRPEVIIYSDEKIKKQVYSKESRKIIRFIDRRRYNNELP